MGFFSLDFMNIFFRLIKMKRDFISITDFNKDEVLELFELAETLKKDRFQPLLKDKTLAMIFEKPSLRTRVTFETGIFQLGGTAIYLAPKDIQLGKRESVKDVATNLSRWVDLIMARTFSHNTVRELAENATVPVINGLSDLEHPCQVLGDFFTILEHKKSFQNLKLAYIGDGNNVCNSLLLASAMFGISIAVGCPEGYEPDSEILNEAKKSSDSIKIYHDPKEAIKDADIVYTDVWTSMGQEEEREKRKRVFARFQVNKELVQFAKPDHLIMHCLPAHRGEEISSEILDGPNSIVLDEAENRLHIQKAIMVKLAQV